jgi:hypothetical protein
LDYTGIAIAIANQVGPQVDGSAIMFNPNSSKPIGGVLSLGDILTSEYSLHMHHLQQGYFFVKAGKATYEQGL